MAQMKAGLAVVEALRAEGVDHTFGVVGTTTNSIVTEMYGRSDIRFVDTRHEEGSAFMASRREAQFVFRKTEKPLLVRHATATSGLPSPSKSPTATPAGERSGLPVA